MFREIGDKWVIGLVSWSLSRVLIALRDYDAARAALRECAVITELENEWFVAYLLEGFGQVAMGEEDAARAQPSPRCRRGDARATRPRHDRRRTAASRRLPGENARGAPG